MKDSQVRIRIPIHHPKEHRQTSLAKESSGSIATSLQKNKLVQQQPDRTGALPPIAKTHRRTTALTSTIHTVGAMLPDAETATSNTGDASRIQGAQPHLRPTSGRAPRWGSRRPWLPFAAMAGVLVLAMAVPALMAWPRQAVQPLPSGSRTAAPAQPNTAAKSE
ncbi:stage II sporulation protein D, partial [Paenibacillus polymyxa]|nr:stage II sporulation protein D [Paenibacillus polymyxa]